MTFPNFEKLNSVQEFNVHPSFLGNNFFEYLIFFDDFRCKMTARTIRFECFLFHQKIFIFREDTDEKLPITEKVCTVFKNSSLENVMTDIEHFIRKTLVKVLKTLEILKNKKLSINIPAGVDDGSRLRLRGEGEQGPHDFPPGDLYVIMHVSAHEFFHREEHDIHCRMSLTFSQAALGAEIQVPLLDEGKTQVISVSAGVQSNDTHRIPGAGIPQLRGRGRGDQIIHFNVETPKHLNKRQKELFKELAEIEGNPIKETLKGFFQKLGI